MSDEKGGDTGTGVSVSDKDEEADTEKEIFVVRSSSAQCLLLHGYPCV